MKRILQKTKKYRKYTGISSPYQEMNEDDPSAKRMLWPVALSFVGHVVLIASMIFIPKVAFDSSHTPAVINVRMVSPGDLGPYLGSDPGPGRAAEQKDEIQVAADATEDSTQKAEVRPAPETEFEPKVKVESVEPPKKEVEKKTVASVKTHEAKPEVSLAPKLPKEQPVERIEVKRSLKRETFTPSEVVRGAIEQLEREPEDTGYRELSEALARLREDVEKSAPPKSLPETSGSGSPRGSGGGAGTGTGSGGGGGGLGSGEIMEVYRSVIARHIQGNWAFLEQLARGQSDLETLVGIKIMPSGEIQDIWFDKKSGNSYLDESAMRAIKKSNPLPPLPRDTGRFYMIGLRFTPKGLDG